MKASHWNNPGDLHFTSVVVAIMVVLMCPVSNTEVGSATETSSKGNHLLSSPSPPLLVKRGKTSPFIVAFQVTRPPGLFQNTTKKPVIMDVMSNMTSMLLGSELARMLSRGISSSGLLLPLNATATAPPPTQQERQFEKATTLILLNIFMNTTLIFYLIFLMINLF